MTKQLGMRLLIAVALTAQVVSASALNAPGRPFGLRLDMTEEAAHERLRQIAKQEKEEKEQEEGGEQEVWILKRDAKYSYLITRFSREHRLVLITVVARPQRAWYSDVGRLANAAKATDGQNYSYKWKVEPGKGARGYMVVARGSHPKFLTSYSVYFTTRD